MRIFGLISVLLSVAIGIWLVSQHGPASAPIESGTESAADVSADTDPANYAETLDAARAAATSLEGERP